MMIPREHLMETARRVYRSYGFFPIDTPSLEYYEILARQGGRGRAISSSTSFAIMATGTSECVST